MEFQAVRTVATRSPGGSDWPHSNLVTEFSREEGFSFESLLLRDILRFRRIAWWREVLGGGFTRRREEEQVHDAIVFE